MRVVGMLLMPSSGLVVVMQSQLFLERMPEESHMRSGLLSFDNLINIELTYFAISIQSLSLLLEWKLQENKCVETGEPGGKKGDIGGEGKSDVDRTFDIQQGKHLNRICSSEFSVLPGP